MYVNRITSVTFVSMIPADDILAALGRFTAEDTVLFRQRLVIRHFAKGQHLISEGEICRSAFYLLSGTVYQYVTEDTGEEPAEKILDLHLEQDWCISHTSYARQKPSRVVLQAFEEVTALEISMDDIHELIRVSPAFFQMGVVLEKAVSRLRFFDEADTAQERYDLLFSSRPRIFQRFPLKMIASYLRMTPETLSRIRARR